MCGRYTLTTTSGFKKRFGIFGEFPEITKNYNISPSTYNPVIIRNSPNRVVMMKWGFFPEWSRDKKFSLINIRKETAEVKPYFMKVLQSNRCLIPADGFYEWKKVNLEGKTEKIPYYFTLEGRGMFSFAGLYSKLTDAEGKSIFTYAIITCPPSKLMESVHNRMPVILNKKDETIWLDPDNKDIEMLARLLSPYDGKLKSFPVGRGVNNPGFDSKDLIKEVNVPG